MEWRTNYKDQSGVNFFFLIIFFKVVRCSLSKCFSFRSKERSREPDREPSRDRDRGDSRDRGRDNDRRSRDRDRYHDRDRYDRERNRDPDRSYDSRSRRRSRSRSTDRERARDYDRHKYCLVTISTCAVYRVCFLWPSFIFHTFCKTCFFSFEMMQDYLIEFNKMSLMLKVQRNKQGEQIQSKTGFDP